MCAPHAKKEVFVAHCHVSSLLPLLPPTHWHNTTAAHDTAAAHDTSSAHSSDSEDTVAAHEATTPRRMTREGPDDATASFGLWYVLFFLIHCLLYN